MARVYFALFAVKVVFVLLVVLENLVLVDADFLAAKLVVEQRGYEQVAPRAL